MKLNRSEISRLWPIAKRRTAEKMVSWIQRIFSNEKLKKNVFRTQHSKHVLLCHLPEAFDGEGLAKHHSNLTECRVIAECFHSLGYNVDCSSRTKRDIDYTKYDILCGINGNAYMGSFSAEGVEPLRIFYSVGAETCYNYRRTAQRNIDFHERHGLWLPESNRYLPGDPRNYYEARFSDAVICLGNEFVREQFLAEDDYAQRYHLLPAFYFKVAEPFSNKDFEKSRRSILWFGSAGLLHKGLDIAIDFALEHKEYTLHICGSSSGEHAFWNYYMPKVRACSNIIMHGFVNIESADFAAILDECGILLNPSVSEGGAVAVLNVLGNGALLPVYSKGTGIDLSAVGIEVDDVAYESFSNALLAVAQLPTEIIAQKAWEAHRLVASEYTLEKYKEGMYALLKEIIEKKR